jgi:hypothetical protein
MRQTLLAIWFSSLSLLPCEAAVAQSIPPSPWQQVRFFIGRWEGTAHGRIGEGTVERSYEWVLNEKFIHVRHKSTYPPQQLNPRGEVHEDWGFISYDRARQRLVLRQFHIESFVAQYSADPPASDTATLVFLSEALENLPAGWRARESYAILSADEFVETFELAAPGKDFEVYTRNHFRRRR